MEYAIAALVALVVGTVVGHLLARREDPTEEIERVRRESAEELARARREVEEKVRAEYDEMAAAVEDEVDGQRTELKAREDRLRKREEAIESRDEALDKAERKLTRREKDIGRREKRLDDQEKEVEGAVAEQRERLEAVAGLSQQEARQVLMDEIGDEARKASIDRIRAIEQEAHELAEERARLIISAAIQRYASEHVADRTVSAVSLPSEDMKGRIIGREGRNIRAFEAASGCDVVIDETPDAVLVSSFNPVRREIGRLAMDKLVADGRIHPSRIEEVVARTRSEMEQVVRRHGEEAALELEVSGLNPEIVKALGRLHYVQSFAQNVLRHSVEVGALAGMMAAELGLKPRSAIRAGLLHDIGKAVDHEAEGDHAEVGAALLRKHGESKAVVNAVAAHRDPDKQTTILAQLVAAANTLSTARPGARSDQLAAYIKRLEDLEELAQSFEGVERVYALQSGAQVRVMVDNARLSDRDADLLSRDIARRIEQELSYPGEVRVTVVRSTRAVQYAR